MVSMRSFALAVVFAAVFPAMTAATLGAADRQQQTESAESLRARATELAYSLQHEEAVALLRRAAELAPDDPTVHRSLASVLWLNMLFRRGAVTVDHYLGSFSRSRVDLQKPPPDVDKEFRAHIARAIELSEKEVAAHPKDPKALYDLGAAVALQASYTATVEGKLLAGFRAAQRAYDAHEEVLALDPSRKDAGLIVGTYRYIVSTLSFPMRMMAYVVGFGGGRDRGIQMIRATADAPVDNRVDALFALILVFNREKQYDNAMAVLQELRRMYPRNRLVVLEAGSTALRAGRGAVAERLLSEGMAMLPADPNRRIPGEEGLWRYKRGAALALLGKTVAAEADLRVATGQEAQQWVQGRARVELGQLALKRSDRETAAREARQAQALCEKSSDTPCAEAAKKLVRAADGR
jgi:tetratricopeptide (TPR) repeat protein